MSAGKAMGGTKNSKGPGKPARPSSLNPLVREIGASIHQAPLNSEEVAKEGRRPVFGCELNVTIVHNISSCTALFAVLFFRGRRSLWLPDPSYIELFGIFERKN